MVCEATLTADGQTPAMDGRTTDGRATAGGRTTDARKPRAGARAAAAASSRASGTVRQLLTSGSATSLARDPTEPAPPFAARSCAVRRVVTVPTPAAELALGAEDSDASGRRQRFRLVRYPIRRASAARTTPSKAGAGQATPRMRRLTMLALLPG